MVPSARLRRTAKREKNIPRFQIPMNDSTFMRCLDRFRQRGHERGGVAGWKGRTVQIAIQTTAGDKLHREERNAALLVDLVNADDMIVLDRCHRLRFPAEALARRRAGGERRQHRLDRHGAVQLWILALKHDSHPAMAQHLQNAISAQSPQLIRRLRRGKKIGQAAQRRAVGDFALLQGAGLKFSLVSQPTPQQTQIGLAGMLTEIDVFRTDLSGDGLYDFQFENVDEYIPNAPDLVVLTNQGATPGVRELANAFARASGHKVSVVQEAGRAATHTGRVRQIQFTPAPGRPGRSRRTCRSG